MTTESPPHSPRWHAVVIVAAAGVVYVNSLRNAFLWDDLHLIVGNPAIKHLSRAAGLFLTELFPHGILSGYYRPLQALTYLLVKVVIFPAIWIEVQSGFLLAAFDRLASARKAQN